MKIDIKYEDDSEPTELELTRLDIAEMIIRTHDQNISQLIGSHLAQCHKPICDDLQELISIEQHSTAHKIENIFK